MSEKKDGARDLQKEIKDLGIIAIEDYGTGSLESTFAAIDAIREYEGRNLKKENPEERETAVCGTVS